LYGIYGNNKQHPVPRFFIRRDGRCRSGRHTLFRAVLETLFWRLPFRKEANTEMLQGTRRADPVRRSAERVLRFQSSHDLITPSTDNLATGVAQQGTRRVRRGDHRERMSQRRDTPASAINRQRGCKIRVSVPPENCKGMVKFSATCLRRSACNRRSCRSDSPREWPRRKPEARTRVRQRR
jgi:hypothetical protein